MQAALNRQVTGSSPVAGTMSEKNIDRYLILSHYLAKIDLKAGSYAKDMAYASYNNDARAKLDAEWKLNNLLREIGVVWNKHLNE